MRKIMMIDIDGVLCDHVDNEHPERMASVEAYPEAIKQINKWHDQGHHICFFTARTENHSDVTEAWLDRHGVRYHQVIYDKPRAVNGEEYHYIDDRPVRATTYKGRFTDLVRKSKEILVFEND